MFLYTTINILVALTVRISGGRLEPENYDLKEYWTWKAPGKKPWCVRAFRKSTTEADESFRNGSDCEMVRVGSDDGRKDETDIAIPQKTLSRFSR